MEPFLFTYPKVSKIHTSETKGSRLERNKNINCPSDCYKLHYLLPVFLLGLHNSMKQHQLLGLPGSTWAARGSLFRRVSLRLPGGTPPLSLQLPLGFLLGSSSCPLALAGTCLSPRSCSPTATPGAGTP